MKDGGADFVLAAIIIAFGLVAGTAQGAQVSIGKYVTSGTTIVVGPKDTPAASGTALLAAVNGIIDAAAGKSYLVRIQPGLYDLGSTPLTLKSYISLQGSGVMETRIKGNMGTAEVGVVVIDEQANIRLSHLTVENSGGSGYSIAIAVNSASPYIHNVSALASGGDSNLGVHLVNSSPSMVEMRCIASGKAAWNAGVVNDGGSPVIRNVQTEASGAADNFGVINQGGSPKMSYMAVVAKGGDTAVGVLNEEGSTPELVHVGVTVSGATDNAGIRNFGASNATIADLRVTVKGGEKTKGIHTVESSTARIKNVSIDVSGGTVRNYGVFADTADSYLHSVIVDVQGSEEAEDIGVECQNASTVRVYHSTIFAATHSVQAGGSGADLKLGCTALGGGPSVGETYATCN